MAATLVSACTLQAFLRRLYKYEPELVTLVSSMLPQLQYYRVVLQFLAEQQHLHLSGFMTARLSELTAVPFCASARHLTGPRVYDKDRWQLTQNPDLIRIPIEISGHEYVLVYSDVAYYTGPSVVFDVNKRIIRRSHCTCGTQLRIACRCFLPVKVEDLVTHIDTKLLPPPHPVKHLAD